MPVEPEHDPSEPPPLANPAPADTPPVLGYHVQPVEVNWVTVSTAGNAFEANLLVSKLQSLALHARIDTEHTGALGPAAGAMRGMSVQVLTQDAAAARTILADLERERVRRRNARTLSCPACSEFGARRVMHPIRWAAWAVIGGLFAALLLAQAFEVLRHFGWVFAMAPIGIALLVWGVTPRWRCKRCGHRWAAADPADADDEDDEEEGEGDDDADDDGEVADEDEADEPAGASRRARDGRDDNAV